MTKDMMQYVDATKLSDGAFFDLIAENSPNREWDALIEEARTSPEKSAKLRTVLMVLAIQIIREQGH
jgi:hypothetical protein